LDHYQLFAQLDHSSILLIAFFLLPLLISSFNQQHHQNGFPLTLRSPPLFGGIQQHAHTFSLFQQDFFQIH